MGQLAEQKPEVRSRTAARNLISKQRISSHLKQHEIASQNSAILGKTPSNRTASHNSESKAPKTINHKIEKHENRRTNKQEAQTKKSPNKEKPK